MANKSPAAQEQRDIALFIEWLEFGLVTANHEFGAIGEKPMKFTRHDGHTFSMKRGDQVITLTLKVTVVAKETDDGRPTKKVL